MGTFVWSIGLDTMVKRAERKDELWLIRFKRRLSIPRAKMDRIWNRYNKYLLYRLTKYGPGDPNPQWYDNFRRLQIDIRRHSAT